MSVRIEATGNSIADAFAEFGAASLVGITTDDLAAELCDRLRLEEPAIVLRIFADVHREAEVMLSRVTKKKKA